MLPTALFLRLASSRAFWTLRAKFRHFAFLLQRSVFNVRRQFGDGRSRTGTFVQLAVTTTRQLLAAVLLVTGLQAINPWLLDLYSQTGLKIVPDTYATLLGTVAATGGVLIGLYYAATTAIAGAIYSNVPNNVRDLLAQDRVGNIYMRFLSFTTFASIVLLGFRAAGLEPNPFAASLFVACTGISVIAFVKLGARAFYLFDPTTLSGELVENIHDAFAKIRAGQFRWNDAAFQNHAHQRARLALDTSKTLAEITSKQSQLSGQPFVTLCTQFLHLLRSYQLAKKSIPSDSRWYPKQYVHPDWYRTEDSQTSLAFRGSGRLPPKEVSDPQWVEATLLPIVHACLRKNIESSRHDLSSRLMHQFDLYVRTLSSEHEVKLALDRVTDLTSACTDLLFASPNGSAEIEPIEQIAIADAIASTPVNILLAYIDALRRAPRETIASTIVGLRWSSKADIYNLNVPKHIIPQLEWMHPRIQFETSAEGARVSPDWYLAELALQPHVQNLKDNLTVLVDDVQSLFDRWMDSCSAAKLAWVRANILTREEEYWAKMDYHFHTFREQSTTLNSNRRIEGLPWAAIDLHAIGEMISSRRRVVVRRMAEDMPALIAVNRKESYPDFAGQFLHTVGESLIEAFLKNDHNHVREVFANFFIASFIQREQISLDIADVSTTQNAATIKVSIAPILDLMSLSGYGLLLSEYHDNPTLAALIFETWNNFLDRRKAEGHDLLPLLAASISITNSAFEIAHRSIIRTQWGQQVAHLLRELPRESIADRGSFVVSRTVAVHKSPLVRVLATDQLMSLYNGIDIFIETLVRKRGDGDSVKFTTRRDLSRSLAREIQRTQSRTADTGREDTVS